MTKQEIQRELLIDLKEAYNRCQRRMKERERYTRSRRDYVEDDDDTPSGEEEECEFPHLLKKFDEGDANA